MHIFCSNFRCSVLYKQRNILNNFMIICIVNIFIWDIPRLGVSGEKLNTTKGQSLNISMNSSKSTECFNKECTLAAYRIQYNMDLNTAPCTDFYKFTCGEYQRQKSIAHDENMISSVNEIIYNDQKYLRNRIENISSTDDPGAYKYLKRFYHSCLSLEYQNLDELGRMRHRISTYGGWPLLMDARYTDQWNEDAFQLTGMISNMYNEGLRAEYLYKILIEPDPAKANEYILIIDQPTLEFSKEIFEKYPDRPFEIEQYYSYMIDVVLMFDVDEEMAKEYLSETLELEYKISQILVAEEDVLSIYDRTARFSLVELMILTPNINWSQIINSQIEHPEFFDYDEIIIVKTPEYLEELNNLIGNTEKLTLANYLIWKMLAESAQFISDELRLRTYEYRKIFNGPARRKPAWNECIDAIKQYFPGMVNLMFANRSKILKKAIVEIIDDMKMALIETLAMSSISNSTKYCFMNKIKSLTYNVGFPMELDDDQKSLEYYNVACYFDNYYESVLRISKRHREYYIKRYKRGKPLDEAWIRRINTPLYSISYDPKLNSIYFGVGNLNNLYIDETLPYYVRFAGIGVLLGQIITQIYYKLQVDGKIVAAVTYMDWCDLYENTGINDTKCVSTQYNNFVQRSNIPGLGEKTQDQNIVDLHGVNIAYKAYVKWLTDHGEDEKLPGLSYTSKQMFWIWYGNTHCTKFTSASYRNLIETGDHVDPKYRVNGPLVNSKYFTKDFTCNSMDYMVIWNKCNLTI